MPILVAAFFAVALIYASVGFGGGSSYTALLALWGVDYRLIPVISLCCNLVVVLGGTVRFARAGIIPWRRALILIACAAPAAFFGGLTPVDEGFFFAVLGTSLILASLALLVRQPAADAAAAPGRTWPFALAAVPLGYLSGLVGIGGGIFLAPLLHLARWANARAVAATASLFILVNSIFGLFGQVLKGGEGGLALAMDTGLPLIIAVALGGQIGSHIALRALSPKSIRRLTGLLTLTVGVRLLAGI